jgi:hypothetical protein
MDERERSVERETGVPAKRVMPLPVEGATQAPITDDRPFEGEAPPALPVEGATQAPITDDRPFEGEAPPALPVEGATQAPIIAEEDWGKGLRVYSDGDDERNRFLTLAMGECWHDFELGCPVLTCKGGGFICGKCRDFVIANNDFGTEEDFSRLWKWARTLPELRELFEEADESSFIDQTRRRAFADKVYEALRATGRSR